MSDLEQATLAARLNADALAEMQRDRDTAREHVAHLLSMDHWRRLPDGTPVRTMAGSDACPDCRAAREWSER